MRRANLGFSLIELVTALLIVGILTAIAVPGWRSYVIRANRADAKAALLSTAAALERCFTRLNAYDAAGCAVVFPVTVGSAPGTYRIEPFGTGIEENSFQIQAVPINSQARDADCGMFRLDAGNERTVTGTKPARDCWSK